jgi:very-short-patch-repair endonuclease
MTYARVGKLVRPTQSYHRMEHTQGRSQVNRCPRALSQGEEAFALHCRAECLYPVREYMFHPKRKWRFDFYFPSHKLAVEVEGVGGGRHQRIGGFKGDCHKYNSAALMGITVLRYTTDMVKQGTAIDEVLAYMGKQPLEAA